MKPKHTKAQKKAVDVDYAAPAAPDRFERIVRFVCGTLLGVLAGLEIVLDLAPLDSPALLIGSVVLSMVLCGWLAMRFGDRFWYGLRHWF